MVRLFRLTFLILCFAYISISAQSISAAFTSDSSTYKVGDYITLTLELRYDKNYSVKIPPVKDSVKVLEYIQTLPVEKKENEGKIIEYHKFIFSKYDSGKVTVPSLPIAYSESKNGQVNTIATVPFSITVNTLKVNTQEDIRDVKEPLSIALPWWIIALAVLLFFGVIAGAYYGYKYWQKKKLGAVEVKPEIKIPPHEIALAKLDELDQKKLWQNGRVKEFHSQITDIVREYFETRFNFRAMEMPSSEILPVLGYLEEGKQILDTAEKFFTNADLVKFAKFEPMPQVNDEMMKQAYQMVKETIPAAPKPVENGVANVQ